MILRIIIKLYTICQNSRGRDCVSLVGNTIYYLSMSCLYTCCDYQLLTDAINLPKRGRMPFWKRDHPCVGR